MESNPQLQLKDTITEQRQCRRIGRREGGLRSNEIELKLPPPIKLPSKGVSASNCNWLAVPHLQPDEEWEEVKGFMDLGFQFNKGEFSPRVLSVLPGLKRLDWQDGNIVELPSPKDVSVDLMKERLRLWARSVASMVKC